MRLLLIIINLQCGGRERQVLQLLEAIARDPTIDFRLIVLSADIYYRYGAEIGSRMIIIERRFKKDPLVFGTILKIARRFNPDIIHVWDAMSAFYALPVAKLLRCKYVDGQIRCAPTERDGFTPFQLIIRASLLLADKVVGNSVAGLRAFRAPMGKSRCIHNGYEAERNRLPRPAADTRALFGVPAAKVVGMVARFVPLKGHDTFIEAAKQVLKQRSDVAFVMVGDGPTMPSCRQVIPEEIRRNFHFLGWQTDVESIVNIFDVGVLCSREEGMSNAIMEYMALGKPVVATNVGGMAEIVVDGSTGFLVQPSQGVQMADKILLLLEDVDLARRMGQAGKKRLEEDFGLGKMITQYIALWQGLMPGQPLRR
ncbi:MAG: hypothetical protein COT06_05290 [Syntrophobacteraceae bacterium CG07_land_8_20_14_0_80_61_8]|nr:MAG: hypothetical protein COT06_05290 [Syntrophobacteraceae bacterium CG07_land_8_20_14_0_80_61_8]